MHKNVKIFCEKIKSLYPQYFVSVNALDCGCLDINGNNRYLFEKSNYIGIDIIDGPNVDFVTKVHHFAVDSIFDVVISTEMLEHDCDFDQSLNAMLRMTKPKGLLIFTAAGTGRPEHGTTLCHPKDSPLTHDYYRNVTVKMIDKAIDLDAFSWLDISYFRTDIRFAGIKR